MCGASFMSSSAGDWTRICERLERWNRQHDRAAGEGGRVSTRQRAPVARLVTRQGITVFRFPVETFPGHFNNLYLIDDGGTLTLVDVGSRLDTTRRDIEAGLAEIETRFGRRYALGE